MAKEEDSIKTNEEEDEDKEEEEEDNSSSDSEDSSSDSDSDLDDPQTPQPAYRPKEVVEDNDTEDIDVKKFKKLFLKRLYAEDVVDKKKHRTPEEVFNFPKDPENWLEIDSKELWVDGPPEMTKPGWDPVWADEEEWEAVSDIAQRGETLPIAPFYLPYRKYYPPVPERGLNIRGPKGAIAELDRIEEFLKWVSFIFPDGTSYEGTVWDDLAHGKGVYVAEDGLVRYEGEWFQNNMEGHGVVEVDIPDVEPMPGSELEERMRAEGKIIKRDYMSPEDREWLEMDIEDSFRLSGGSREIPFYENNGWIRHLGEKPEKGRYRYAGQWKHGRMHGCGVYEVNERPLIGKFYFGELVEDDFTGCDEDTSMLHAGIAEVAAAKARMFVNKPDGMVREERGPYNDPQHAYMYEGDDVWMAPGFINQFHEVPDNWKMYVHEVDEERQMWLNSFYKAPLRIPMPAELEYWWSKDEDPEFAILKKEPEPDPEDPSKLVTEDPLILHRKTGRLINFVEDEEHGIRLFWQPLLKEGEEVDPEKTEFLPLGFDEFYGRTESSEKKGIWDNLTAGLENMCNALSVKMEKWSEEKKKASDTKLKLIEEELEFIDAELCLEEEIEDMESELELKENQEEVEKEQQDGKDTTSVPVDQDGTDSAEEDEVDDDDEDGSPTSFGSVIADQDSTEDTGNEPRKSPFAATSMSFASNSMLSVVPSNLQQSFLLWKNGRCAATRIPTSCPPDSIGCLEPLNSVSFPRQPAKYQRLKATGKKQMMLHKPSVKLSQMHYLSQILSTEVSSRQKRYPGKEKIQSHHQIDVVPDIGYQSILSMHVPIHCFGENVIQ